MSSGDRFPYLTAMDLDQAFLDACHDNLTCNLEMIAEIEAPDGTIIYASDRNKYVGSTFYEALLSFPPISRTIGDWLQGALQFSQLKLSLSNVDGRFNHFLPGGADYDGWVGNMITVKLGLRDVAATYKTIFRGTVTPDGGFGRDVKAINLLARDDFDKFNQDMPTDVFTVDAYPDIQDKWLGKAKPIIYGDWTLALGNFPARVPAIPVNGADEDVVDPDGPRNPVQLVVSVNANRSLDDTQVWVRRGQDFLNFAAADIAGINGDKNYFEINQGGVITDTLGVPADDPYEYAAGDEFFVQVTGKDLGAYSDNFVEIARDILIDYGSAVSGDFHANWNTFRDKATPAESAIASMKGRLWQQTSISALSLSLSLLEQVRLEAFIDRDFKIKINALHFDEYLTTSDFHVRNWDVVKGTFTPQIDVRNNFTRAKGFFSVMPDNGQNEFETSFFSNPDAITQSGREITKGVVFPNHYELATVNDQTKEVLKLASAFFEVITCELTWRAMLLDIGDTVLLNVQIGSTLYEEVPCLVRDIGFDPKGLKVTIKLWSFQLVSFPGYTPVSGSVGGYDATINEET